MKRFLKLPQIEQHSPQWYAHRANSITSTKVAPILHLSSYRSYDHLLKEQPDPTPKEITPVTRRNAHQLDPLAWGTHLEPVARELLEQQTLKPIGILGLKFHDKIPYLGASPDGIQMVGKKPRLIEIKCPKTRQISYRIPLEYWVQCQIAMEVWDIDSTLYCEFKFDLHTGKPNIQDFTLTFRKLTHGVYAVYQNSWTTVIKRNRQWFNSIKDQLDKFYQLKYQPVFSSLKGKAGKKRSLDDILKKEDRESKRAKKDNSDQSNLDLLVELDSGKKRKRSSNDSNQEPDRKIIRSNFHIQKRLPINKLSNYIRKDPILDWFDLYGEQNGYEKDYSLFLDYYNQQNLKLKLNVISKVISQCQKKQLSFKILNPSINNLLQIYQENILLKIHYDYNLLEETQLAISEKIDLIILGQLSRQVHGVFLWETFDLLVSKSVIDQIFPQFSQEFSPEEQERFSSLQYYPVRIKLTTLEYQKGSHYLRAKHSSDQARIGSITDALLLDKHGNLGILCFQPEQEVVRKAIDWLDCLEEREEYRKSPVDLYPNMKNRFDSTWRSTKSYFAQEQEELTQINFLGVDTRNLLHQHGIKKISQLDLEKLDQLNEEIPNLQRMIPHIDNQKLYLPRLKIKSKVSVYLDFENTTSLGLGQDKIIFQMGVLIEKKDQEPEYTPFLVEDFNLESQDQMIQEGLKFIAQLKTKGNHREIPIYHWGHAEPTLLKSAGFPLPEGFKWVDLYAHFSKHQARIPGCYTYGLKDVASKLHELGLIKSQWLHGLDGNTAMAMAWNIAHKAEVTGAKFKDDPRMKKLCEYNYVDCKVLQEIKDLIS